MAASGNTSVAVTSHDTLKFSWWINSQSTANNTTTIGWAMQLIADSYGRISSTASKSWSVVVNGTTYSGTNTVGLSNGETKTLASGTTTIAHNSDGSKTFSYSFSQQFGITFSGSTVNTKSGSGSGTLTTIPRASSLTASNGTLNTAQTLTISRADSTFKHKITYTCGSTSGYAAGSSSEFTTATSISWTPPLSLANQNKTGTSLSCTLYLKTYNSSGTQIGSVSKVITLAIPASVKPTVSLSVTDSMGYANTYGSYVQGRSKLAITVTSSGSYGSTIKSRKTTFEGSSYTSESITTNVIKGSGSLTVTCTVTDSRGRSNTASKTVTVLAYNAPKITTLNVSRCTSDGTSNSGGDHLKVAFKSSVTALNDKNTASYAVQYKKTSENEYTSSALTDYANVYTVTDGVFIFAAESSSSYDIILSVTDSLSDSVQRSATGSSISKLWSVFSKGVGIAFGKIAEVANTFDVAWLARFRDHVCIGDKTGHLDGKQGVFLSKEGYMHLQRTTAQNYNPYIGFLLDDETSVAGQIRMNSLTRLLEFMNANGYSFDDLMSTKKIESSHTDTAFEQTHPTTGISVGFGVGSGGKNHGIFSKAINAWLICNNGTHTMLSSAYGTYRPYYTAGDSFTVELRTAGFVTGSKGQVQFHIPLSKPVYGASTCTITSVNGLMVRCNDAYTHGSSATVFAKPTSYTCEICARNHLNVIAAMSSTANAVNNTPVGVYAHVTVTFS